MWSEMVSDHVLPEHSAHETATIREAPDEVLIVDERGNWTPGQAVERKLLALLGRRADVCNQAVGVRGIYGVARGGGRASLGASDGRLEEGRRSSLVLEPGLTKVVTRAETIP